MLNRNYAEYATEKAVSLLAIDSPTGYTKAAAEWVKAEFAALGYSAEIRWPCESRPRHCQYHQAK